MGSVPASTTSFSPWRRLSIAASVALSIVSVIALAVMSNYLARHYAPRFHWGASNNYRLSALTLGALQSLTNEVRITVFFDRDHPVYPSVRALLREYTANSPRLHVEELDYSRNPVAAKEFRRRFPMTVQEDDPALVLFESGGRTKVVPARDLRDYDAQALIRGEGEALPTAFKGEPLFTSAINAVCEGRPRRVYVLRGHREHEFASKAQDAGYSRFAGMLEEDNIELRPLTLNGIDEVPSECELLIIAGPRDRFSRAEIEVLDRYLRRGGRMLVLLQYRQQTGLETLLAEWGVEVDDNVVVDPENSDDARMVIVSRFGNHPVTRPLGGARLFMFLPRAVMARPVANIHGAPARIEPLLYTGTNGIVVTRFFAGGYVRSPDDIQGEIPLAVAVERGALPGVAASLGTARIVVVGESSFLADRLIQLAGNQHFAASAVNWLLDRAHLLGGIQPSPIRTYQISITPFQQRMLRTMLLGVLPGGALVCGLLVWWRRH